MPAGRRRHLVVIETKGTPARDAVGGEVPTWAEFAQWWAEVLPIRGNEYVSLRAAQSDITLRLLGLYLGGVTTTMRVQWNGNPYEVVEAINVRGRSRQLELLCNGPEQGA